MKNNIKTLNICFKLKYSKKWLKTSEEDPEVVFKLSDAIEMVEDQGEMVLGEIDLVVGVLIIIVTMIEVMGKVVVESIGKYILN